MRKIDFSVVICTYNRAETLRRTLESLCSQSYLKSAYEILVINNNSTDHTEDVCREYMEQYSDCKLEIFNEPNQGISFARNRGVKEAKGKFIVFIDDDETIGKDHLKILKKYLQEYPYAQLVASAVVPVYESKIPNWMSPFTQRLIGGTFEVNTKEVKLLKKNKYPGTGHTIVLKSLFDKYGLYNTDLGRKAEGLMGAEDKDMAFRWMENNVSCYFFPHIPIYHHIPAYKLSKTFFNRLTYSLGVSERVRTKSISERAYKSRLYSEFVKWIASIVLCFWYFFTLRPAKGFKLLVFRKNVTTGLLSKP